METELRVSVASEFYDDLMAGYAKLLDLGPILSSPVVAGHAVYVTSADGNVYALDEVVERGSWNGKRQGTRERRGAPYMAVE